MLRRWKYLFKLFRNYAKNKIKILWFVLFDGHPVTHLFSSRFNKLHSDLSMHLLRCVKNCYKNNSFSYGAYNSFSCVAACDD